MSMQLYIKYAGITLDFQANGYEMVGGFYPETPDEGMEIISDQFTVRITGTSGADLHAKKTAIRLALEHAKEHKDDALAAYVYFDIDDSGDAWMSKMLKGAVHYDSRLESTWRNNVVVATIIIEHKPYWDQQDEVQVPLTNGNGTNNTAGLVIFNCGDNAGASPNHHDNYVEIAAADVLGDMQGPTRLEVLNSYATSRLYTLWIGQNWTDPDNMSHILEGESSTIGTETDDTTGCSNGHFMRKALASGAEADLFTWALTDSFLDACKGGLFKILARFHGNAPTNVKFRIKLEFAVTNIWQTGQATIDASRALQIRELFTFRLPPWLLGQTNLSALTMTLTGQQSSGSSVNVDLDFLQITPLDGWRMLECAGYGVVQNSRMIDDGVNENAYIDDGAGDNKAGILVGYGNPIKLYPGKKQRLYFLMHSWAGNTAEIARTISLKLFYHPRRQSL